MKRRHFIAAAIAAASLSGAYPALAETDQVRVGYIADFWGASATAVATEQGLWEKHGLDADTKVFTNGPLQIQALGTNSLDFGYIGPGPCGCPHPTRRGSSRSARSETRTAFLRVKA
ncbi:ABC transporter substrate-binding protein [Paracoccus cavernae]|uniref:ABC transporter substrate-binding protein n=1 Tax=Paracoccus cavernae TaxID=1571207 RepID=UPI00361A2F26